MFRKQFAAAIREYTEALRLSPDLSPAQRGLAEAHFQSGMMLAARGDMRAAVQHWREALQHQPDHHESLNAFAWTLTTSRDDTIRNGGEALKLAEHVARLTDHKSPGSLDALAAAYAANDRYADAIQTAQKKPWRWPKRQETKKLAQDIQLHLETRSMFRSGPWS